MSFSSMRDENSSNIDAIIWLQNLLLSKIKIYLSSIKENRKDYTLFELENCPMSLVSPG